MRTSFSNRIRGVSLVEAIVAAVLLGVVLIGFAVALNRFNQGVSGDKAVGEASGLFDSIRLITGTKELCEGAFQGPSGPATLQISGATVSNPILDRIVRDTTTIVQVGQVTGKVRIDALSIRGIGVAPRPDPSSPGRVRVPAFIQVSVADVERGTHYVRELPTQLVLEPSTLPTYRVVSCFVQNFQFESALGRIVWPTTAPGNSPANFQVSNQSLPPTYFGAQTINGVPADQILKTDPADTTQIALGCREDLGWRLVNCNRITPSGANQIMIADIVNTPPLLCKSPVNLPAVAQAGLEIVCMRVNP